MRQMLRRGAAVGSPVIAGAVYFVGVLIVGLVVTAPAGASQNVDHLPDAGVGAPLIALIASLFVVTVGTAVLLAARRASRDE